MFDARPPAARLLVLIAALWFAVLIATALAVTSRTGPPLVLDGGLLVVAIAASAIWVAIVRPPFHVRRDLRLSPDWFAGFYEGPDEPDDALDAER